MHGLVIGQQPQVKVIKVLEHNNLLNLPYFYTCKVKDTDQGQSYFVEYVEEVEFHKEIDRVWFFKPVSVAVREGLEKGVVKPEELADCSNFYSVQVRRNGKIRCLVEIIHN